MDYAALLSDPIYETFGVAAVLAGNRPEAAAVHVTAIERTTSDASEEFELGTLRPGAFVRRRELDEAGVAPAELDGGSLVLRDRIWLIEAHVPRPGPDGEASGEILMHLVEDANGWFARADPGAPRRNRGRGAGRRDCGLQADEATKEEERASYPNQAVVDPSLSRASAFAAGR
jgi:hypothetical protein